MRTLWATVSMSSGLSEAEIEAIIERGRAEDVARAEGNAPNAAKSRSGDALKAFAEANAEHMSLPPGSEEAVELPEDELEVEDDIGIGTVVGEVFDEPRVDFGNFSVTLEEARDAFFRWETVL